MYLFFQSWTHTLPLVVEDTRDWYEQSDSCFIDYENNYASGF